MTASPREHDDRFEQLPRGGYRARRHVEPDPEDDRGGGNLYDEIPDCATALWEQEWEDAGYVRVRYIYGQGIATILLLCIFLVVGLPGLIGVAGALLIWFSSIVAKNTRKHLRRSRQWGETTYHESKGRK